LEKEKENNKLSSLPPFMEGQTHLILGKKEKKKKKKEKMSSLPP